jgi:hypothetical protein
MCGAAGSWPRPFAVGVLALPDPQDAAGRSQGRLDVALDAYKLGYFLLDTIETGPDGVGYLTAELLAARTGADAVVARGPVDGDRLSGMADRHRLVVHA